MDSLKQDYLGNLRKKTKPELLELLQRQEKLLANKKFISKLPDKGLKITRLKEQIEEVLALRSKVESTTDAFTRLRISTQTEQMHDHGGEGEEFEKNPSIWETLASNEIVYKKDVHSKVMTDSSHPFDSTSQFYDNLTKAIGSLKLAKEPFRVYKTKPSGNPTIPPDPSIKPKKYEEESAVRYPIGPHKESKTLSLEDSLRLEKEHMDTLKQLQWKHVAGDFKQNRNEDLPVQLPIDINYRANGDDEANSDDGDEDCNGYEELVDSDLD